MTTVNLSHAVAFSKLGWFWLKFLHWLEWGCVLDLCCEHKCWHFRDVLVTAGQSLHRVKAFCASCTTPPVRRLELQKKLGGDTAERADPKWPKGTSPRLPNLISWLPSKYPLPFSHRVLRVSSFPLLPLQLVHFHLINRGWSQEQRSSQVTLQF